jgi:PhoPQ-activated pathogenicity-related protein
MTARIRRGVATLALIGIHCATARGADSSADGAKPQAAKVLTELDRYVSKPDSSFAWKVVARRESLLGVELVIALDSQTWRASAEVDRTLWQHWLTIAIPRGATSDAALLIIAGGANGGDTPKGAGPRVQAIAQASRAVVAELGMVPNQPLAFAGDGKPRKEDSLLAFTWDRCLSTDDLTWPGQLPMTKSAVRAMDAIQAALANEKGAPAVKRFVVAGGSKRGWTTWLTAAVDPRVAAIAPIVIDLLNIDVSMRNHHGVYGFWSPALDDYVEFGLPDRRDDPEYQQLLALVDPYSYRERLTMPKCIINASGDEFFTPDSSRFYFDDLPGEKLLSYQPNAGHSLEGSKVLETLTAFFTSVVRDLPRPKVDWELTDEKAWRVTCAPTPKRAMLWQANNPKARDFRLPTIGKAYTSTELTTVSPGVYEGGAREPAAGYTAYFIQMEFDVGAATPLFVSTPVAVTPDVVPFAEKLSESGRSKKPERVLQPQ